MLAKKGWHGALCTISECLPAEEHSWLGLADIARHVIKCNLKPRFLTHIAPCDVTSNILLPATSSNAF
jgi:hypothetical protein